MSAVELARLALDLYDGVPSRGALAAVGLGALAAGLAIGALIGRRRR